MSTQVRPDDVSPVADGTKAVSDVCLSNSVWRWQMIRLIGVLKFVLALTLIEFAGSSAAATELAVNQQRLLYVASPGVRDNLEWGGHGVLVFDINAGHRFVKRIPLSGH